METTTQYEKTRKFVTVSGAQDFAAYIGERDGISDVKITKRHVRGAADPYQLEWIVSWNDGQAGDKGSAVDAGQNTGTPAILHQCGHGNVIGYVNGKTVLYCAECGKEAVITCQRCDGTGWSDADERGMIKCPVCDGEAVIDYAMVAEYANQIDSLQRRLRMMELGITDKDIHDTMPPKPEDAR